MSEYDVMTALDFELRVLSGFHRGAKVALGDQLSLGSTHDYDVLLRDPGMAEQSAVIELTDNGWILTENGTDSARRGEFGKPLSIGGVVLTVDVSNEPWPPLQIEQEFVDATDSQAFPESEDDLVDAAGRDSQAISVAAQIQSRRAKRKQSTAMTVVFIASGFVAGFLLVAAWLFLRAPVPNIDVARHAPAPDTANMAGYRKVLAELGLENKVRIDVDDGGIRLVGMVDTDATLEILSNRLATFSPRPGLSVMTTDELVATGNAVVRRFSPRLQLDCREAQCTLRGTALSASAPQEAARALAAELPQLASVEADVRLPSDIGEQFLDMLKKQHIEGFEANWDGQELVIAGARADDGNAQFITALLWLGEQCRDLIPFRVTMPGQPAGPHDAHVSMKPPFDIVAVVGGQFPYVTTASGHNVLLGGTFMGYRLVDIQASQIIFAGPRPLIFKR